MSRLDQALAANHLGPMHDPRTPEILIEATRISSRLKQELLGR
jgi:hypothetical protein